MKKSLHSADVAPIVVGQSVLITGPSKSQRTDAVGRIGVIVAIIHNDGVIITVQVRESPNSIGDYPPSSISISPKETQVDVEQNVTVSMIVKKVNYIEGLVSVQARWAGGISDMISIPLSCIIMGPEIKKRKRRPSADTSRSNQS